MSPQHSCLLCGADSGEITVSLVEWREPIGTRRWQDVPRCRDVDACWSRVTGVLAEEWPVADGRPVRVPARTPQPVPEPEPPPPDAPMEDPSWLVS